jgi:hypothetical protein
MWLGGAWEAPVSWRKPVLFGLSTGITLISLGLVIKRLRAAPRDSWLLPAFALALVAEVGLISLQQWRGQPSHFNRGTPFDATIDRWMTCLIVFATLVILDLTQRCFRNLAANVDMALAIRAGMAFLLVSCLTGFAISIFGHYQSTHGQNPSVFGKAGAAKFPHGIALHSLQWFPILSLIMKKAGIAAARRYRLIHLSIASTALLLVFAMAQTIGGRSRLDIDILSGLLLSVALLLYLPVVREIAASLISGLNSRARGLEWEGMDG